MSRLELYSFLSGLWLGISIVGWFVAFPFRLEGRTASSLAILVGISVTALLVVNRFLARLRDKLIARIRSRPAR